MLKSSLCDYSDAYIAVKRPITVPNTGTAAAQNNTNKELALKNSAPFIDCISEINNTQIDNAKDIDEVVILHNLIEYNKNYLETSVSLWQISRDKPSLDNNDNIIDFLLMMIPVFHSNVKT